MALSHSARRQDWGPWPYSGPHPDAEKIPAWAPVSDYQFVAGDYISDRGKWTQRARHTLDRGQPIWASRPWPTLERGDYEFPSLPEVEEVLSRPGVELKLGKGYGLRMGHYARQQTEKRRKVANPPKPAKPKPPPWKPDVWVRDEGRFFTFTPGTSRGRWVLEHRWPEASPGPYVVEAEHSWAPVIWMVLGAELTLAGPYVDTDQFDWRVRQGVA